MSRKTAFVGFSYMAGLLLASFFSAPLSIAIGAVLLGFGLCTVFIFRPKHSGSFYRSAVCAIACCVGLWIYSGYDMTVWRNITANIPRKKPFISPIAPFPTELRAMWDFSTAVPTL